MAKSQNKYSTERDFLTGLVIGVGVGFHLWREETLEIETKRVKEINLRQLLRSVQHSTFGMVTVIRWP